MTDLSVKRMKMEVDHVDKIALDALKDAVKASGKTPAAWLQEICVKSGILPHFAEKNVGTGPVHEPTFEVTATVKNFSGRPEIEAKGVARNKKEAKQDASLKMLYEMGITPADLSHVAKVVAKDKEIDRSSYGDPDQSSASSSKSSNVTAVTKPVQLDNSEEIPATILNDLTALCAKKGLPIPIFNEDFEATGPPHSRTFTCECTIKRPNGQEPFNVRAQAGKKATAKRKAAHLIIKQVRDENISSSPLAAAGANELTQHGTINCDKGQKCNELFAHQHHQFLTFQGQAVRSLHESEEHKLENFQEDKNYMELLKQVADEENFAPSYNILCYMDDAKTVKPYKDKSNNFQCECKLAFDFKVATVSTIMGSGVTEEIAKNRAAYEALLFLKEVTVVATYA